MVEGASLAAEAAEAVLGGADALDFSLGKKSPAKETRIKRKTEVNSDFSF